MSQLIDDIINLRNGIRNHRDQNGDYRCWLDDVALYRLLPDSAGLPIKLPPWPEMERKCKQFFDNRQCPKCPHTATVEKEDYDKTLKVMGTSDLEKELLRLQNAIRAHREKGEGRTYEDDEKLYSKLPDGIKANTRLTGEKFIPSCRRFWETRQNQHPQKLHEW